MGQKEQASNPINQEAVRLIRAAFSGAGMTQQQLADASGIPRSTLANILSPYADARLVHVGQLVRIAIALDIDLRTWAADLEAFERRRRKDELGRQRAKKKPVPAPAVQKRAARKAPASTKK